MCLVFLHISMFLVNMITASALVKKEADVQELMVPVMEEGELTALSDKTALRFAIVSDLILGGIAGAMVVALLQMLWK